MKIHHYAPILILLLAISCRKEDTRVARFSGTWKITQIITTVYNGEELMSESTANYDGTLYLTDDGNSFANNPVWIELDSTASQHPFFAFELQNYTLSEILFGATWSIGPHDNKRLSFMKQNPDGITESATTLTMDRNALGKVISWQHNRFGSGDTLICEKYIVKQR